MILTASGENVQSRLATAAAPVTALLAPPAVTDRFIKLPRPGGCGAGRVPYNPGN